MKAKIIPGTKPTRIGLQKVRKRILLSQRGLELLQDKLDAMTNQISRMKTERDVLREKCSKQAQTAHKSLARAVMSTGWRNLEAVSKTADEMHDIDMLTRSIMGRVVPEITIPEKLRSQGVFGYSITETTTYTDRASREFEKLVIALLRLAEAEGVVLSLENEIKKTRRRVNALENMLIPSLNATSEYIENYLEELEREDLFRRKRSKAILKGGGRWH
ncbi:V/A-type H+-transporting ATPase subunit D [Methanomicrobium sp. W14]|uniref:V-type ATP synthase subunit D n=1 Tax=Methanomicrobium sp. W14 TaxID=2817839 RepID=UPI001AE8E184|nr:V-type ATP synthase subunit D [Methanomicrobium sp. W14]MBP2133322.1 V/A-type H+-transporting ATPase subunit D [Methanomicrobium sp. W14]